MTGHYLDAQQYKQEIGYFDNIVNDFLGTIRVINFAVTRYLEFSEKSMIIFGLPDIGQSIIAINQIVREGALNPARRELRYTLELAVKYLYVDLIRPQLTLEEKVDFFNEYIPRSSIDPIDDIPGLSEEFVSDVKDVYYHLCAYVHPSKQQIDEYLGRLAKGTELGFESFKELFL